MSKHVIIVLGNPSSRVQAQRVRGAELVARHDHALAAVLSGHNGEAAAMAAMWTQPTPLLLEEAARTTAENAALSLPLVLALGGVSRVTFVTSSAHLRAPFFFRPYRAHGLLVKVAYCGFAGTTPWMIVRELGATTLMRQQRRQAYAAPHLCFLRPTT